MLAILPFGGMSSALLLMPDYGGAALLHLLSTTIIVVALIPHGPALQARGGVESSLLLSGWALAVLCAAAEFDRRVTQVCGLLACLLATRGQTGSARLSLSFCKLHCLQNSTCMQKA